MADVLDMVTLDDAKAFLKVTDSARDTIIEDHITQASKKALQMMQRQVTPTNGGGVPLPDPTQDDKANRYAYDPQRRLLDFAPFDARTVTSIVLDPDDVAEVLDPDFFMLHPQQKQDGVFSRVTIDTQLNIRALVGRHIVVEVTGNWGFLSVPEDLQRSILKVVDAWFDTDQQAFSEEFDQPSPESFEVPNAAIMVWKSYRRTLVA